MGSDLHYRRQLQISTSKRKKEFIFYEYIIQKVASKIILMTGVMFDVVVAHFSGPLPYIHLYSETGLHIGMERNFVCSWCRPNCRSQVIDLSLSALIS